MLLTAASSDKAIGRAAPDNTLCTPSHGLQCSSVTSRPTCLSSLISCSVPCTPWAGHLSPTASPGATRLLPTSGPLSLLSPSREALHLGSQHARLLPGTRVSASWWSLWEASPVCHLSSREQSPSLWSQVEAELCAISFLEHLPRGSSRPCRAGGPGGLSRRPLPGERTLPRHTPGNSSHRWVS